MTTPDETEEPPSGARRDEPPPPRSFDPLFSSAWEELPLLAHGADYGADDDDPFGTLASAWPAYQEDEPWQLPPGAHVADITYPDRLQEAYRERQTDLQRQLRLETITIARPRRRWAVTVRELAETVLLALLIFMAVRASFQNFRVEGASMQPSLEDGEYLIVNKLAYSTMDLGFLDWLPFVDASGNSHLFSAPERGEIIVFRAPTSPNKDFIKRIIGLPGDTIEIDDLAGRVLVNGTQLSEPYISGVTHCNGECKRTIPAANTPESRAECGSNACYFVMGDNRQNSSDSRQGWLVPEENIVGKALITYWHHGQPELDLAPNHSLGLADEASAQD